MSSKQDILAAIRQHDIKETELPSLESGWITYPDRVGQFAQSLGTVGGRCVIVPSLESINTELAQVPAFADARKSYSLLDEVRAHNSDLDAVVDPHDLEDVDFAILPGEFGVAENGAIWVTDAGLDHRVLYFIAQHLALVISADRIVDNMHQAYEQLAFAERSFGTFISGPSKTADIEQSLVIGAHGPRSLTVFVVQAAQ